MGDDVLPSLQFATKCRNIRAWHAILRSVPKENIASAPPKKQGKLRTSQHPTVLSTIRLDPQHTQAWLALINVPPDGCYTVWVPLSVVSERRQRTRNANKQQSQSIAHKLFCFKYPEDRSNSNNNSVWLRSNACPALHQPAFVVTVWGARFPYS